jgi:serine/threonine protein phosphatase PrpC
MVIKEVCYVANVGDCRAIMSVERGFRLHELSHDHKPNLPAERERVEQAGGKIYANEASPFTAFVSGENSTVYRVLPGRLAISRAFGDADAKLECFGGIRGVVIAEPDVKSFRISKKYDFILIASDGVFDKLTNSDAIRAVWTAVGTSCLTFHGACGEGAQTVLEEALRRTSLDNVSVVLVAFKPLRDVYEEQHQDPSQ